MKGGCSEHDDPQCQVCDPTGEIILKDTYEHLRDDCDGGICVKCNRCTHPECCPQGPCPEKHWLKTLQELVRRSRA